MVSEKLCVSIYGYSRLNTKSQHVITIAVKQFRTSFAQKREKKTHLHIWKHLIYQPQQKHYTFEIFVYSFWFRGIFFPFLFHFAMFFSHKLRCFRMLCEKQVLWKMINRYFFKWTDKKKTAKIIALNWLNSLNIRHTIDFQLVFKAIKVTFQKEKKTIQRILPIALQSVDYHFFFFS